MYTRADLPLILLQLASMLDEEEGAAPAAFKDYFFKYGELKEYLKYRHLNSTSEPADPEQALKSEKDFLRLVCVQLKRVDKCDPTVVPSTPPLMFCTLTS